MKALEKECIVNQNDMFLYFEIINRIEPDSIIDIGMFLKRIGAISRQVNGFFISENVVLDGIDVIPDFSAKVYEKIYNNVAAIENFADRVEENALDEFWNRQYDLAIMLRMESVTDTKTGEKICEWISGHARYAVVNDLSEELLKIPANASIQKLNVENDSYSLVIFNR